MRIDHIGIATDDLDDLATVYETFLGCPLVHEEEFDGLRLGFLEVGSAYFELLEPLAEGTIARYLEKEGPGIHHIGLQTDDIDAALATAREAGIELLDAEPRPGGWGHTVAFLHPSSTGGVLFEFVEH